MSLKAIEPDGTLVPAPRDLPSRLFEDFDRRDDAAIIAELQGAVVAEYVYSFKQGGTTVTGLSLPGVMAVAQNMGGITCGQPIWTVTDDDITCDISATDHKVGLTVWGTATELRIEQTRNGATPNKFARAKALSKAQRNAIRKVIPETVATEMLKAFIGGQRPERQRPPAQAYQPPRQVEPPYNPSDAPQAPLRPVVEVVQVDDHDAATVPQINKIYATARGMGWTDDEIKAALIERFQVESSKHLTRRQASEFIDNLSNP